MASKTENPGMYWMATLASLVACIGFLMFLPEWFWVTLPFLFTSYVKAMNWI